MTSKNILIISPFFFPEPISTGKYNTDLAIELSKKGHKVTVLCFHPFYPDWKVKSSKLNLENIKIIRGGKNIFFTNKTFVRRLILELSFGFFILRKIREFKKNIDIIIPIFPPSFAFYFNLLFIKRQIKKIGIVHDLQEVYSSEKKGFINKCLKYFIHKVEKKCFKSCDKLIFLSNEMKSEAKYIYNLKEEKLIVQYPFININSKITNDLAAIFDKTKTNIVYSGALGEKQNPNKLYEFFIQASKTNNSLNFYFFSKGVFYRKLKKQNKNPQIHFYDLVDKSNLKELYNLSDVQIVPQKENTSKGSLPSKLPNLLASDCKVLIITDPGSEIESIFKKHKLNDVVTSWHTNLLINALEKLISKDVDFDHQQKIAKELFTIQSMLSEIVI
ncbi:hypothetical protein LPB03_08425 [Polaribacter vadi]|uniref:Glycosyltransferase subfamily 4-like N-terminal domain-containing protein n=1 Tax=Polaribacter vadi TaxID=1774273 RepID=A0A1B8U2T0_9FLAO|nr:glycosyltransferase [Polaribacter vadi]AOW17489.1 hypothetical protein LPB03_08425 [Polaribacter vadi]OBY66180.1 hypothetical protein LPB3_01810 [Polaribacter vadi]